MSTFGYEELVRNHANDERVLATLETGARVSGVSLTKAERADLFARLFESSSERRAEFGSKDAFVAFMEARFNGKGKVFGGPLADC